MLYLDIYVVTLSFENDFFKFFMGENFYFFGFSEVSILLLPPLSENRVVHVIFSSNASCPFSQFILKKKKITYVLVLLILTL